MQKIKYYHYCTDLRYHISWRNSIGDYLIQSSCRSERSCLDIVEGMRLNLLASSGIGIKLGVKVELKSIQKWRRKGQQRV